MEDQFNSIVHIDCKKFSSVFTQLLPEVNVIIMSLLPYNVIQLNARFVCKSWYQASVSENFWKSLFLRDFGFEDHVQDAKWSWQALYLRSTQELDAITSIEEKNLMGCEARLHNVGLPICDALPFFFY
jgi:hypothetical protein